MSRLVVLMITAFVDMVGLLIILPLLPYYAVDLGGGGVAVGVLVAAYAVAQLVTAPLWGRVSDRFGRRPAILVSLGAAAIAYVIFGYAETLGVLLVSRLVQGAGGGTTGVIQAYVSDVTEPDDRAKSLGWLSAATSAGVMVGPAIGSLTVQWGTHAPGLIAAGLCVANMVFAWKFLRESHTPEAPVEGAPPPEASLAVMSRVVREPTGPAPRLIWTYTLAMGAFQGMVAVLALFLAFRFDIGEDTIGFVFLYTGFVSVITRAVLLGRAVDLVGEERLSRAGMVLLLIGLAVLPFTGEPGRARPGAGAGAAGDGLHLPLRHLHALPDGGEGGAWPLPGGAAELRGDGPHRGADQRGVGVGARGGGRALLGGGGAGGCHPGLQRDRGAAATGGGAAVTPRLPFRRMRARISRPTLTGYRTPDRPSPDRTMNRSFARALPAAAALALAAACAPTPAPMSQPEARPAPQTSAASHESSVAIVIHGGAGTITRDAMTPEREREYTDRS
jgi:multidrug resistance protein